MNDPKKRKTVSKMFSITPVTLEMLKKLASMDQYFSQSEVVRKAVLDLYDKHFPEDQQS